MRSRGFTLLETLLVLVIVTGLTTLVSFQGTPHRALMTERAFWPAWQRMWTAGRQRARQQRVQLVAEVQSSQHQVVLVTAKTAQVVGRLRIPPTLQLQGDSGRWLIYTSGASKAQTLRWYSTVSHQYLKQTFQLGGGIFYVAVDQA
ncbi:prepilin-type N-terminal cleavage/methylation domain-containing protein [Levilactobacillus brevis]|nr:prepilin-type N-terminal cleavage/methylation domain-containing protein [Levilactobacillus brevis]